MSGIGFGIGFCPPDEISLGIFMGYGEDEIGTFHMTSIGFFFFEISMLIYQKQENE